MGELHVYSLIQGRNLKWERTGDQGDMWLMAEVNIPGNPSTPINIEFEGVVGSSFLSDIAIDDLSIRSGACDSAGIAWIFFSFFHKLHLITVL